MKQLNNRIGMTVRQLRLERNLSQEQFSEITGLHRTYISPLENGRKNPRISTMAAITQSLGIELSDFFKRAGL